MKKDFSLRFKKILPYILVVAGFIVLAYLYAPQVLSGKIVNQYDISSWKGMANEIVSHNQQHPEDKALWTNSMFSGMPATMISVIYDGDYTDPLYKLLLLGKRPASYLFISLLGGFLLFLAFGMNIWLSVLGAIAITFCSYNMQIIQVGHNTKMIAIAFMPWVLAAVVYAYRKAPLWGAILFAFALSFQIKANHPQITYYLAIIVLGYAITQFIVYLKQKRTGSFVKVSLMLLVAGLLGIATNTNHLLPTFEYQKYSMRGGSELKGDQESQGRKGLDLEYALAWSYGIEETPNLLIPNFNGGGSSTELSTKSNSYNVLYGRYEGANQIIKHMPTYWGPQPSTAGPMYMGAVSIFLFVLGLCLFKGSEKWWIAAVSLLAIFLAWGSHFMFFSELFFKYAPLYNKFRTVSMALTILQITIPVMGILVLDKILRGDYDKQRFMKGLYISLGVTAGISLIFAIIPSLAGSFSAPGDVDWPKDIVAALQLDRVNMLRSDAFRSVVFILLAAGALWLGFSGKIKREYCVALIGLIILTDLWSVDKRYLNESHFVTQSAFNTNFNKRAVDNYILQDKDPHYRVLDLTISPFNNSYISYHHKTIGGYSPAKLQRYQDLIERYIVSEFSSVRDDLKGVATFEQAESAIGYKPILSMLNTKYFIIDPQGVPLENRFRLGNAWFVDKVIGVSTADQEIEMLGNIDPSQTAVISENFLDGSALSSHLSKGSYGSRDRSASIELTHYSPNRLNYSYSSSTEQITLFSEVYYPAGWKVYIDGKEGELFRANYILRGVQLPEGDHEIVLSYEPESFKKGAMVSSIASSILILCLLIVIVLYVIRSAKPKSLEKPVKN